MDFERYEMAAMDAKVDTHKVTFWNNFIKKRGYVECYLQRKRALGWWRGRGLELKSEKFWLSPVKHLKIAA